MMIKLADIKVGERYRKKFEDMESLKESIKTYGIIEPLVIDEKNILIAGERRYRASQSIGLVEVPAVYMKNLSIIQKKEIEIEENIQRKQFTWQEEIEAKVDLHELKQRIHGTSLPGAHSGWGLRDTALALGKSESSISLDLQLAEGMRLFPELTKEKNKTIARNKLKMLKERLLSAALAQKLSQRGFNTPDVMVGKCEELLLHLDDKSVNLILTDPPYGVEIDKAHTFNRMSMVDTGFSDDKKSILSLYDVIFPEFYRVLKHDSHLFMFFAIDNAEVVREKLEAVGFTVDRIPLIWNKNSPSFPGQCSTFMNGYEVFYHCRKGKAKLIKDRLNVFNISRVAKESKWHVNQKPTELLKELIELTTYPGDIVLDPFAGSGSTGIAAYELKRQAVLIEFNPVFAQKIQDEINIIKGTVDDTTIRQSS